MLVFAAGAFGWACASEPKPAPKWMGAKHLPPCRPWEDPPYNDTGPCGGGLDVGNLPAFDVDGGLRAFKPNFDIVSLDAGRADANDPAIVLQYKPAPWYVLTLDGGR